MVASDAFRPAWAWIEHALLLFVFGFKVVEGVALLIAVPTVVACPTAGIAESRVMLSATVKPRTRSNFWLQRCMQKASRPPKRHYKAI